MIFEKPLEGNPALGFIQPMQNENRSNNQNNGMLYILKTGKAIRPATETENNESVIAAETDGGIGAIVVDGVTCYVQ